MANYKKVIWGSSILVLLVVMVSLGVYLIGSSVPGLFLPPCRATYPGAGFFFIVFKITGYASLMACLFSFRLLRSTQLRHPDNLFILCSALVVGLFLSNEEFRIHVHFARLGISKLAFGSFYAIAALTYGLAFWRRITQSTPYLLLFSGLGFLILAVIAELLPLQGSSLPSLVEGIPKLLGGINIALYYWYVCQDLILRSLVSPKTMPG